MKRQNLWPILVLILLNILVFMFTSGGTEEAYQRYALLLGGKGPGGDQGIRYLSSMFVHSGISHLYSNMIALLIFGMVAVSIYGYRKVYLLYFGGGIIAGWIATLVYSRTHPTELIYSVGASGAVYAIIGAVVVAYLFRSRWGIGGGDIRGIVLILMGAFYGGSVGINTTAHIAGLFVGMLYGVVCILNSRFSAGRFRR